MQHVWPHLEKWKRIHQKLLINLLRLSSLSQGHLLLQKVKKAIWIQLSPWFAWNQKLLQCLIHFNAQHLWMVLYHFWVEPSLMLIRRHTQYHITDVTVFYSEMCSLVHLFEDKWSVFWLNLTFIICKIQNLIFCLMLTKCKSWMPNKYHACYHSPIPSHH